MAIPPVSSNNSLDIITGVLPPPPPKGYARSYEVDPNADRSAGASATLRSARGHWQLTPISIYNAIVELINKLLVMCVLLPSVCLPKKDSEKVLPELWTKALEETEAHLKNYYEEQLRSQEGKEIDALRALGDVDPIKNRKKKKNVTSEEAHSPRAPNHDLEEATKAQQALNSKLGKIEKAAVTRAEEQINDFKRTPDCIKRLAITTSDKAQLDSCFILNPGQVEKESKEQKWIVYFNGNSGTYEDSLSSLTFMSALTGANVLSGNYRGVGHSTGFPSGSHDLVVDGEAMVQYLLSQGVPPENILLHGYSTGGGVAAEVAALHQDKGHEMPVCLDRTFTSYADVAASLVGRVASWIIHALGWTFDTLKLLKGTLKAHKVVVIEHSEDEIIKSTARIGKERLQPDKKPGPWDGGIIPLTFAQDVDIGKKKYGITEKGREAHQVQLLPRSVVQSNIVAYQSQVQRVFSKSVTALATAAEVEVKDKDEGKREKSHR